MATQIGLQRDLELRLRIEVLMAEYVHCIDDDRLEEWPNFFTDEGIYRITNRENYELNLPVNIVYCNGIGMFQDRVSALRKANIFEPHTYVHITGGLKILESDGTTHQTKSNFTIFRTMAEGDMSIFACGKYVDQIVEQGESLKFSERTIILESRQIHTLLVIPI